MVAQIMSLEQAAALRYFFIPSSWGTSKMPAWARAWADAALLATGFKDKVRVAVESIKADLGPDGVAASKVRDDDIMECEEASVWEWLQNLSQWRKKFRPGSLKTVENKIAKWVEAKAAGLVKAPDGENSSARQARCDKLAKLSEVMTAMNAVGGKAVDKKIVSQVNTEIAKLEKAGNANEIESALRSGTHVALASEEFQKAVRSLADIKLSKEQKEELGSCRTKLRELLVDWWKDETFATPGWEETLHDIFGSLTAISEVEPTNSPTDAEVHAFSEKANKFRTASEAWSPKKLQGKWTKLITAAKAWDAAWTEETGKKYVTVLSDLRIVVGDAVKPYWDEYSSEVRSKLGDKLATLQDALKDAEEIMFGTKDGLQWPGFNSHTDIGEALKDFKANVSKDAPKLYKVAALPTKLLEDHWSSSYSIILDRREWRPAGVRMGYSSWDLSFPRKLVGGSGVVSASLSNLPSSSSHRRVISLRRSPRSTDSVSKGTWRTGSTPP